MAVITWSQDDFTQYHVTGVLRDGRRFKLAYDAWYWADGINLYRGSVWGVRSDGSRRLLKRVYN